MPEKDENDKWVDNASKKIDSYIDGSQDDEKKEEIPNNENDKNNSQDTSSDSNNNDKNNIPEVEDKEPQSQEDTPEHQILGVSSAYGTKPDDYEEIKKASKHSFWKDMKAPERDYKNEYGSDKGDDVMDVFWKKYICGFYDFVLLKSIDYVLDFADWVLFKRSEKKEKEEKEKLNMYSMAEKNYKEKCEYIDKRKDLALSAHSELVNNLKLLEEGKEPVWYFTKKDPELKKAKATLEKLNKYRKKVKEDVPEHYQEHMATVEKGIEDKNIDKVKQGIESLITIFNKNDAKSINIKNKLTKIKQSIKKLKEDKDEAIENAKRQVTENPSISTSPEVIAANEIRKLEETFFAETTKELLPLKKEVSKELIALDTFYNFPKTVSEGAAKAKLIARIGYRLVAEDMTVDKDISMLPANAIDKLNQLQEAIQNKDASTSKKNIEELLPYVDGEHPAATELKKSLMSIKHKIYDPNCDYDKLNEEFAPIKNEIIKPTKYSNLEFVMINREENIERQLYENIDKIYDKCKSDEDIKNTIKSYFTHISEATKDADFYTRDIADDKFKSKFTRYHKVAAKKTKKALESISNFMLKGKTIGDTEKASVESFDLFDRKNKNYEFIVKYNAERRA